MKKVTSLFVALMLLLTGVNYAQSTNTAAPAPKANTEKKAAAQKTSTTSKSASATCCGAPRGRSPVSGRIAVRC